MGAYGISGKQNTPIGSNAYYVIKNAGCPVLIIPEERQAKHFTNVLYPVRPDYGTLRQFGVVKDIAAGSGPCYFEILAILDDNGTREADRISGIVDAVELEMNANEKVKISVSYNVEVNIVEEILQKVSDIHADLLIISSTIDAEFKEYYVGPFAHEIICRADIPFLSLTLILLSSLLNSIPYWYICQPV